MAGGGFYTTSQLSLCYNMERVGGCFYLNHALKSLRLPRVDISLYLVFIRITVIFMKYARV